MKKIIARTLFATLILGFAFTSCKKEGCTDSKATNYDAEAKKDDGSCVLPVKASPPAPTPTPTPDTSAKKPPTTTKKPTKSPSTSTNSSGALGTIGGKKGKNTSGISNTGDNKSGGSSNDVKYYLGAYGWVVDSDGYGSPGEIIVLVIADDEDIIFIDAVLSDEDGYYEFDWTLTQDGDLGPPSREIVVFTYDDAAEDICNMSDDFNYFSFTELSDTEYEYQVPLILECD